MPRAELIYPVIYIMFFPTCGFLSQESCTYFVTIATLNTIICHFTYYGLWSPQFEHFFMLTVLSRRGMCASNLRSSTVSSSSPLRKRSSLTEVGEALRRRSTWRLRAPSVSLLCVDNSTSSRGRPGLENLTSSDRCLPRHALTNKQVNKVEENKIGRQESYKYVSLWVVNVTIIIVVL